MRTRASSKSGKQQNPRTPQPQRSFPPPRQIPAPPMRPVRQPRRLPRAR